MNIVAITGAIVTICGVLMVFSSCHCAETIEKARKQINAEMKEALKEAPALPRNSFKEGDRWIEDTDGNRLFYAADKVDERFEVINSVLNKK